MDKATQKTMFSSKSMEWATPQHFFDQLNEKFGPFTLDPCSNESNYKVKNRFTEKDDGLNRDWSKNVVFMNPPYGRGIKHWIKKAYEEGQKPNTIVVCLIPSRTDTKYWHEYCMKAWNIHFVKGRLKFKNENAGNNSAPFPSAVIVFKNTKGCGAHGLINLSSLEVR